MRLASARHVLFGVAAALLAMGAGGVSPVAPPAAEAQPQPTIVLSPSSGPCDAVVEVAGGGFPTSAELVLYLVQPGGADVSAGALNAARVDRDGTFGQWVGLQHGGCDAAALDSQSEQPAGYLTIAAAEGGPAVQPGERVPDIMAVAQYAYTTKVAHVSTEALTISPASGPCDGTVEVAGTGFEPGAEVLLKFAGPGFDDSLGTLGSAVPDAAGRFVAQFTLGNPGCRAAQADILTRDQARAQPQITIWAERAVPPPTPVPLAGYPTPEPVVISTFLARADYAYTTTEVAGDVLPRALPATGSGPEGRSTPPAWLAFAGGFAGTALILVLGFLCRSRRLHVRR